MNHSQPSAAPDVVLVDDDEAVLNAIQFSLELDGFSVKTFANGNALLDQPDLAARACLVIDYHMPALNGLELLRALRQRGIAAPAILITSDASETIRRRATSDGAVVVEKPTLLDLTDKVRELLAASGNPRTAL